jgi:hypothetical protein
MDFSKLSQNEKLATYGSVAVLVGGLVGYSYGLTILAVLAAVGMLAIVFLPQLSAGTKLPGSKGSLMLVAGAVAGVILVLALLIYIGTIFTAFNVRDLFFLIAVAGGVLMAWAGWREFQGEGGKFQVGTASSAAGPAAAPPPASVEPSGEQANEVAPERTADTSMDTAPPTEAPRPTDDRDAVDREDRPTS